MYWYGFVTACLTNWNEIRPLPTKYFHVVKFPYNLTSPWIDSLMFSRHSAGRNVQNTSQKQKHQCSGYRSPPLEPIISQMNPFYQHATSEGSMLMLIYTRIHIQTCCPSPVSSDKKKMLCIFHHVSHSALTT